MRHPSSGSSRRPRFGSGFAAVLLCATLVAAPVWAQDDEDDEPSAFGEYLGRTKNSFLIGVNSVSTMPADPVMSTVDPIKEFADLPGAPVSTAPLGLVQGMVMGAYRLSMGVLDIVFSPLPFVSLSPEPRYKLIPGIEYE